MKLPKSRQIRIQSRQTEVQEIQLLESWIEFGRPESGTNPLSAPSPPPDAAIGRLGENSFSLYAGCGKFEQLPLSEKTKNGLREAKYQKMTDIQRASLPHSLCGRDILGAAKTGSGKTLAFIIPVLEKLYRARWGHEDGVGSIIISPTRELAGQIFQILNTVGKHHSFSAGLLIGGRKDVDTEKERVNELNILICTPGRLLQHMDETPNFDCSQLQILVLDEADRILDVGFKKALNAIISQLPKQRQTLLFSATQTKSVQDLARLSLKDPEYLSVHEESVTATPNRLHQTAITVTLDQKLDMLWSFIKAHLKSRILVFLSSSKQVKFVFETFKKLRPGIPLKCLYGRMKQDKRMGIYSQFCEKRSVLFSTDVAARGLDFDRGVDWVVQVDCPEDVATYIHRVGRTARFNTEGKSVIFLMPSEIKMLEKLQDKKIPIQLIKANTKRLQPVSALLAALLAKYENLRDLAQRAFITYLKSIYIKHDKEIFDVMKLPIEAFSASLGLPMTPRIRFLKDKSKGKKVHESLEDDDLEPPRGISVSKDLEEDTTDDDVFLTKEVQGEEKGNTEIGDLPPTRVLKKKKLKINLHRPVGTRIVFNDDGKKLPPLATLADMQSNGDLVQLDKESVKKRYEALREELEVEDKEDKLLDRKRRKEKRVKQKLKWKKGQIEGSDDEGDEEVSLSDEEASRKERGNKRKKIYFDDDDNDDVKSKRAKDETVIKANSISLAEQEELALKLLGSLHS